MNCQNCKELIPATYVAAIKENKCPACGQACLSEKEHTEIFSVVENISTVSVDISYDTIVKLAVVLHGKFDIFPKGVVVDNVVEKEIVYVQTTVAAPTYANPLPTASAYVPTQPAYAVPVMNQFANPPLKPHLRQTAPSNLRGDQMSRYAEMVSKFENQGSDDEYSDDEAVVTTLSKEQIELEEAAKTRRKMAEHRAMLAKGGNHG